MLLDGRRRSTIGASTAETSSGPSAQRPLVAFNATTVCRRIFGSMWVTVVTSGAGGDGGGMIIVGAAKAKSKFNM